MGKPRSLSYQYSICLTIGLAAFASAAACTRDLDGQPCPCIVGYQCCAGICLSESAYCPETDGDASDTSAIVGVSSAVGGSGDQNASTAVNSGNTASVTGQLGSSAGGASGSGTVSGASSGMGGDREDGGSAGDDAGSTGGSEPGSTGGSGVPVLTHAYDSRRSGANLAETELTPDSLLTGGFGIRATRQVSGAVYAQPLYVPELTLDDGSVRNVVFVATARNYVFAFDADDAELGPLWVRQLGKAARHDQPNWRETIFFEAGIIGTPVISLERRALYLVAQQNAGGVLQHRLHGLDLATGDDLVAPVVIADTGFESDRSAQISALLLVDDTLYVAFGNSILDEGGYGHLFAYDAVTLALRGSLSSFEGLHLGPIWMHGQGPAWDGSAIYVAADAPDTFSEADHLGSRLLRIQPASAGFGIEDWFLPSYVREHGWNELGTSGPLPLPGTDRVLVAGNRAVYVLDKHALGHYVQGDDQIVQKFLVRELGDACDTAGSACNRIFASPILWDRAEDPRLYLWASNDVVRAFAVDREGGRIDCGAGDSESCEPAAVGETGAEWGTQSLSFSADGDTEGTGLVWTLQREADGTRPLSALDAESLDTVWSSAPDEFGPIFAWPFAAPVITGGRVFLGTKNGLARVSEGGGPALAVHAASSQLVTAWLSNTTFNLLGLATSSDGRNFVEVQAPLETSIVPPVLASDGGARLFLARVDAEHFIHVVASEDAAFESAREIGAHGSADQQLPLDAKTSVTPALAYGDGRLFLAWRSEAGDEVSVVSSPAEGGFDLSRTTRVAVVPSSQPPALFYSSGRLQLMLPDAEAQTSLLVSEDAGATFVLDATLPIDGQPAVVELDSARSGNPDTYLFWFGDAMSLASELRLLAGPTLDPSQLSSEPLDWAGTTVRLSAGAQPLAATVFRGSIYLGWPGSVARYTPGELVSYGLTPAP